MVFKSRATQFRLLILAVTALALILTGCRSQPSAGGGRTTAGKESLVALGNQAVKNLGGEQQAAFAVLAAWDRGYSVRQIAGAINDDKLKANGGISEAAPESRPQNFLQLSARPVLLAARDIKAIEIKTAAEKKRSIREAIEGRKANWTAWVIGVAAKGYSVEQITMYMLEKGKPATMVFPAVGPVITESRVDPKTGKRVLVVVKPDFPPKGSEFDPRGIGGAEGFASDLARDFDELVSGKTALKPAGGAGGSAAGREQPGKAKSDRYGYPRYYKGKGTVTKRIKKPPKYENPEETSTEKGVSFEVELLAGGKAVVRRHSPVTLEYLGRWTDKDTFSVDIMNAIKRQNEIYIEGRYDEDSLRANYTYYAASFISDGEGYGEWTTYKFILNRVSRL